MDMSEQVRKWETDAAKLSVENFSQRAAIIDKLEFIAPGSENITAGVSEAVLRAAQLKNSLEQADKLFFSRLRSKIGERKPDPSSFRALINKYVLAPGPDDSSIGYDTLDLFVNGLFLNRPLPVSELDLQLEMVFYQKTPARIVLQMAAGISRLPQAGFVDIGSGLGQTVMLVHLLTGFPSAGIEYEPTFYRYATRTASDLNFKQVSFSNVNALKADYSGGTVFFLYSPFEGTMLQQVLQLLQRESHNRIIRIFSYGPCSQFIAAASWLLRQSGNVSDPNSLCCFQSR